MKVKCVIIDDEELASDVLKNYILLIDSLELTGTCKNAVEAYNLLQKTKVDLLFLDINLPLINGIEFLKNMLNPPKVIFTTAYSEYAVDGFDLNAVDYLLKPVSFERFLKAVNKITPDAIASHSTMQSNDNHNTFDDAFIYVKEDKVMVKVMLKDILYIESLKNYVKIKTSEKEIVTYKTISSLEEKLPPNKFLRIHRSFVVGMEHISEFSNVHIKIGKTELPIGRNHKNEVMKVLNIQNISCE